MTCAGQCRAKGGLPQRAIDLSFELYAQIGDEDAAPAVTACFPYIAEAELAGVAAVCYRQLAEHDPALAVEAERQALYALNHRPDVP